VGTALRTQSLTLRFGYYAEVTLQVVRRIRRRRRLEVAVAKCGHVVETLVVAD
jgi:hypothetical protein